MDRRRRRRSGARATPRTSGAAGREEQDEQGERGRAASSRIACAPRRLHAGGAGTSSSRSTRVGGNETRRRVAALAGRGRHVASPTTVSSSLAHAHAPVGAVAEVDLVVEHALEACSSARARPRLMLLGRARRSRPSRPPCSRRRRCAAMSGAARACASAPGRPRRSRTVASRMFFTRQEVGDEARARPLVELLGGAELLDAALVHHRDAVAHR